MPHCQNCNGPTPAEELVEHPATGALLCSICKNPAMAITPPPFLEDLDYEFSYSKKKGIHASARLGGATVSVHVPQEEIAKVFK